MVWFKKINYIRSNKYYYHFYYISAPNQREHSIHKAGTFINNIFPFMFDCETHKHKFKATVFCKNGKQMDKVILKTCLFGSFEFNSKQKELFLKFAILAMYLLPKRTNSWKLLFISISCISIIFMCTYCQYGLLFLLQFFHNLTKK